MSYQWILSNVSFFLFLALLAVIYIANGHMADKTIRRINSTAKELKELEFEYKTVKSEMMNMSQEYKLVKVAEPLGLRPGTEPPVRIPLQQQETK